MRLEKNRKKGGAVQHGVLHSRGERVLMVDADAASRFQDLELLWESMDLIESGGHAVAVGSRAHMVKSDAVVKVSQPHIPKILSSHDFISSITAFTHS